MPAQDRRRSYREDLRPPATVNQPGRRSEPEPIDLVPPRPAVDLTAQHLVLVTEHQQLNVLGQIRADKHRQQAEQTPNQPVDEQQQHAGTLPAAALIPQQNASSQYETVHVVLQGMCRLVADGGPPIVLGAGDVVFLPHGCAHEMADPFSEPPAAEVGQRRKDLVGWANGYPRGVERILRLPVLVQDLEFARVQRRVDARLRSPAQTAHPAHHDESPHTERPSETSTPRHPPYPE
jgi:uncharacterized cupin superfamily protein